MTAADGLKALAVLDSGQEFELLLSNFTMPNLDGIGLLERTRERFPSMVCVIHSAVRDVPVFLAALQKGAYDYLQIPFTRETLTGGCPPCPGASPAYRGEPWLSGGPGIPGRRPYR